MASPQKENGHVDIANEIVDSLAKTYLSSYESQTLWAIFRKTYGWHKKEDKITGSQLSKMTGISESHISRTLKGLARRNIIIREGKKIAFQKNYEHWEKLPIQASIKKLPDQDKKLPIQASEVTYLGKKKLPIQVNTKETKRNSSNKTIQKKIRNTISEFLKEDPEKEKKKANGIEFDFESLSWHGIDDDIKDDWEERFPDVNVGEQLMKIREHFKNHPEKEKYIKNYNLAIYVNDWLERASGWKKETSPCDKPKNENGVCSHLWGDPCGHTCCRGCKEYDCNTRCKLAERKKGG